MSEIDNFLNEKPGVGVTPSSIDNFLSDAPKPTKGILGQARDLGLAAAKSAIAVPEIAVGAADLLTGGRAGKALENQDGMLGFRPKEAKEFLGSLETDQLKAQRQQFADADGVLEKTGVALANPSLIGTTIVESAAPMLAGGLAGRGVKALGLAKTGAGAAGIGEGAVMAGSAAEQIRQQSADGLLTGKQTALALGTGALGAAVSAAGGKLTSRYGLGDADTLLVDGTTRAAARQGAAVAPTRSLPAQIAGSSAVEGAEELAQSVPEQVFQNEALGRPLSEGLTDTAVMGALAGGVMGAGSGVVRGFGSRAAAAPVAPPAPAADASATPPAPPVGPVSGAPVAPAAPAAPQAESQPAAQAAADQQRAARIAAVGVAEAPPNSPLTAAAIVAVDSGAHDLAQATQQAQSSLQDSEQYPKNDQSAGDLRQAASSTNASQPFPVQSLGNRQTNEVQPNLRPNTPDSVVEQSYAARQPALESSSPLPPSAQSVSPSSSPVETPIVGQAQTGPAAELTRAPEVATGPARVLQNRDRSTAASISQMNNIAKAPDYLRAGQARVMENGAPVVFGSAPAGALVGKSEQVADGTGQRVPVQYAVVESSDVLPSHQADGTPIAEYAAGAPGKLRAVAGNGRAAGIAEGYRRSTAAQYRQDLTDDAENLDIDPAAVAAMRAPVLVRVMPEELVTDDIGDRSNIRGAADLSPTEQAANDTRRIDIKSLEFDESGMPDPQSIARFVQAMSDGERNTLIQPDGITPTRQLIDRITSAAFKAAYGNDEVVRLQAQSTDTEIRNIITAMASAAGPMANLEGVGDFDIRGAVAEAAQMAVNAKRSGIPLTDYLNNADINFSGEAFTVAAFMADNVRSAKRMGDGLRAWATYAAEQAAIVRENETQGTMFGPTPTADRAATFNQLGATNEQSSSTQIQDGGSRVSRIEDRAPRQEAQPAPEQNLAGDFEAQPAQVAETVTRQPEGITNEPQADQAQPQQTQPETPAASVPDEVARPAGWRNNRLQAGAVARKLGIDAKGMSLDGVLAEIDRADAVAQAVPKAEKLNDGITDLGRLLFPNYYTDGYPWQTNWTQESGISVAIDGSEIIKMGDKYTGDGMMLRDAIRNAEISGVPVPPEAYERLNVDTQKRTRSSKRFKEFADQLKNSGKTAANPILKVTDAPTPVPPEAPPVAEAATPEPAPTSVITKMRAAKTKKPTLRESVAQAKAAREAQEQAPASQQASTPAELEQARADLLDLEKEYKSARGQRRIDLDSQIARMRAAIAEREPVLATPAPGSVAEKARAANAKQALDGIYVLERDGQRYIELMGASEATYKKYGAFLEIGRSITESNAWLIGIDAYLKNNKNLKKYAVTEATKARGEKLGAIFRGVIDAAGTSAQGVKPAAAESRTPAPDTLTTPAPQDIIDQQARAEAAAKAEKAQQRAADELARRERERKDIAKASTAAADTFELGGNAEQNLSGQQSVFDAPTPKAAPAPTPKPTKQPNAAKLRAEADLMNALADLGDIFSKPFKSHLTDEQTQKLMPAMTRLLDAAFRLGYIKFKDAAKFALDKIQAAYGDEVADAITLDHLQGAYIGMAGGKVGADTKRAVIDVEDKAEITAHTLTESAEDDAPESPVTAPTPAPSQTLTQSLAAAIEAGNMPKDNPALKKLVESFDGQPADQARMKQAQEELETAIAMTARKVVAKNEGDRSTFDALLRMYESQPNLNVRTSTSIANQAYSTPAPLAFLASRLAGITSATVAHEPTAGTGMLLIGADPKKAIINELNDLRIGALEAQGFTPTQKDAATQQLVPAGARVDAVITNPPFGSVKDGAGKPTKIKVDGFNIGQIDHLIAARALEAMKQDGKATLILGANKATGGLSTDDRIFFNWLYANYNVTGHFEVNGDLYTRQGAGWPVRVISINGRMKSGKFSPVAGTIQRADNWSEVYEQFTQSLKASNAPIRRTPDEPGKSPASVVPAPAPTGASRPRGGTAGAGNVTGTSPRVVPDRTEPTAEPVGAGADEQRLNAQSYIPEPQPGAKPAASARPAKPAGAATLDDTPKGNEFQMPYTPRSARKDEGVLIPANMAQPTQDALSRLEDEVGDIDEFARKELDYKTVDELHGALMGLQVDSVATAIWQIKRGKAVVIADQTGIGKGRQAASIIRWAAKQGMTPVFVSVKPSLFTDMYGDLADIGTSDINPFILNGNAWVASEDGTKLFANKPATHKATLREIVDSGKLPGDSNAMFMTYSQINVENMQRGVLRALAPNAVFVLDESHNAAGASATGQFVIETLGLSKGVTYLSATYAKRPDNMPLYFKTDIGDAAADAEGLSEAMAAGGLPLQTVVSNNLVKAGQMFRRERSYDGVSIASTFDTPNRALHERMSNEATKALRAIVSADKSFHSIFVKNLSKELASEGSSVKDIAGNQASAGVQHTEFSSVVHNFVKQMLLGLKAQTAADEAIASLKRGEKPVIAVENTMGSFLNEYAASNNIAQGASLGSFDYRTVLSRALERTRVVVVTDERGNDEKRTIPLSELDFFTAKAYQDAADVIDGLKLSIPVSPIDWMRAEIARAGFSVAEITGRNLSVDYSDPKKPILAAIEQEEQKDKVNTTRLFNSGKLDALILNVAGSTGISLHASEKFEDQRQRHMIVAQAAGDINIFMQMIGRVHRTGQVRLPKYSILSVDLPTEKRPTAVLSVKMKSLNANTSSNTESATSVKTADILNKYGDQIVDQYLNDNYALARALGLEDEIGGETVQDDIARKATGRLALQPIETQHAFYDDVEAQYAGLIEYLNKTNQNDLEPRTFDFDAKETRQEVLFEGPDKSTPFGEDAIYGEYSIKAQGHPMKPDEIRAAMTENLAGLAPPAYTQKMLGDLDGKYQSYINSLAKESKESSLSAASIGEYNAEKHAAVGDALFANAAIKSASEARTAGQEFLNGHQIGSTFRVDINGEPFNAVVINIRNSHKEAGNPFSLSKMQLTVAVNGALRSLTIPATQFKKIEVSTIAPFFKVEQLFKEQPANQRETAKIVTGNLLAAYGELKGTRGTIITFTKQDGTSEQGILLPKLFDYSKNTRGDYRLSTGKDALKFLQKSSDKDIGRFGIMSRDGNVRVLPAGRGVRVQVPKSKLKGGKFFLDKELIAIGGDFVSMGGFMTQAVYEPSDAAKVLDALMKKQALYALPSMAEEAKQLTGDKAPAFSRATTQAKGMTPAQVQAIADKISAGWTSAPKIIVAANMADPRIPQAARDEDQRQRADGATGNPEGFVHDGVIYLLADQLASPERAATVLMHEALGHIGLQGVFGDSLKSILQQVATMRQADVKAKAAQYGLDMSDPAQRLQAAEEVLAEMAQSRPEIGFVRRAVAAIRNWLRGNVPGFKSLELTDSEIIQAYLLPARGWVERGRAASVGGNAAFSRGAADQADTTAFKKWFGDSVVVDDDGRPLVVYHGTDATISSFSKDLLGSNTKAASAKKGFFFASAPSVASSYATGNGANVAPVYLSAQNPFIFDFKSSFYREDTYADLIDWAKSTPAQRIEKIKRKYKTKPIPGTRPRHPSIYEKEAAMADAEIAATDGLYAEYDSAIFKNTYDPGNDRENGKELTDIYVVFEPEQIKSAIGNSGAFDPTNPDIRFSRSPADIIGSGIDRARSAANAMAGRNDARAADMPGLDDEQRALLGKVGASPTPTADLIKSATDRAGLKMRQGVLDRYASLKELDERTLGADFLNTAITDSSWVLAKMASAAGGALNSMMTTGRIKYNAGQKVIELQGEPDGGLTAALKKLGPPAEVERFFAWVAANRASKLLGEGRENLFTPEEIAAGIKLNTGDTADGQARAALYKTAFNDFQKYRDDVLAIAEAAGIVSAENRALWRDEFYVPFYRIMDEDAKSGGPAGGGGLSRQEAFKRLKGGKQNLNDLMENTLMNFHHLLGASLKNQAAAQAMRNAERMGIARQVPESRRDTKTSTFVLQDGKKVFYQVDDPLVFESLTALSDPGLNSTAVQMMSAFKRVFTQFTTVTPQFIIANTFRDLLQASSTSPTSKNIGKNFAQGIKSYRDEKVRAEMLASGGAFSFGHIYGMDAEEVKASLRKTVAGAELISSPSMIPGVLKKGWKAWDNVIDASENISRAATYVQNVEQLGKLRAAFEARDVMDFSQHGAWPAVRLLIRVVPFLNARLQGLDKLYRSGIKPSILTAMGKGTDTDKQAAARFATVTGALTVATMVLYLANADDDEYKKLEDWQKDSYWFIRIGGNAFFLPRPFEVGAIATLAERTLQQAIDDKATGKLFAERIKEMLMQTFAFNPVPQMFQPMLDVYSNRDAFTGRDIESMGMERLSPGLRARDSTTAPALAISAATRVFGDESPTAISPVQADHLIKGYLGGVGASAAGILDTMYRAAIGQESPDKRFSEYQPIKRFYRDLDTPTANTRYSTLFYDGLREANRVYADVRELQKLGRTEDADELTAKRRNVLQMRIQLNAQQRRLTDIGNRLKEVRRSENDGEWKRRELDLLNTQRGLITERMGKMIENERANR